MIGHFDFRPDPGDSPIRADQEGRPIYAHVFLSEHRFLAPHAIGLKHGVALVGTEADAEVMFGSKLVESADRIGGDTEDACIGLFKGGFESGKVDGFLGAAGRIGLGVEVENELPSLEIGQRYFASVATGQTEGRRLAAFDQNLRHMPSFRRFQRVNLAANFRLWAKADERLGMSDHNHSQVNQAGDLIAAGHTDKGMSDRA